MNELCPNCKVIRELELETMELQRLDDEGKEENLIVRNYYCATCHIFVKSEEEAAPS